MTSNQMTLIGVIAAMTAFVVAGLPQDTPVYVKLMLGSVNAGLPFYTGLTNKGTK